MGGCCSVVVVAVTSINAHTGECSSQCMSDVVIDLVLVTLINVHTHTNWEERVLSNWVLAIPLTCFLHGCLRARAST